MSILDAYEYANHQNLYPGRKPRGNVFLDRAHPIGAKALYFCPITEVGSSRIRTYSAARYQQPSFWPGAGNKSQDEWWSLSQGSTYEITEEGLDLNKGLTGSAVDTQFDSKAGLFEITNTASPRDFTVMINAKTRGFNSQGSSINALLALGGYTQCIGIDDGDIPTVWVDGKTALSTLDWSDGFHTLCITVRNSGTDLTQIFWDGVYQTGKDYAGAWDVTGSTVVVSIGGDSTTLRQTTCVISWVGIFDGILPPAEIASMHGNPYQVLRTYDSTASYFIPAAAGGGGLSIPIADQYYRTTRMQG